MRVRSLFLLLFLSVIIVFSNFISPVEGADKLVSTYGEARLSQDLNKLNFLLSLGISTWEKTGIVINNMKEGYVERIITNHPFYGTAIFINHPDNTQARYMGLSRLTGDFVKLYEAISVEFVGSPITITFDKDEFFVEQNQPIGYSGASGFFTIPSAYIQLIDLESSQTLNPINYIDMELDDLGYQIFFKRIRINTEEYPFAQGAVYPFTGDKPMVDMLIENASSKSEFKFALEKLKVKVDGVEVLSLNMNGIPLAMEDKASRIFGEKTNRQTFWYRLTTPWTTKPIVKNEIRKIKAFNDKIKVEVEATDVFGTVQTAEFWLKRR
ncbi:MAG: hypothetical protein PWQ84_1373 [Thermotogaceae bacterium]|nr:hypothetical protein [Thermotogaceae bacterium]